MLGKLTLQNVIVIGIVVSVVIASGIFFVLIRPTQAEIKNLNAQIEAASQRAAQLPAAKRQLEDAKKEVEEARQKWARYERSKMPNIDMTDRLKAALAYWKEPERTAKVLQDFVSKSQDVIFLGGFAINVPTTDPNQLPWPIWIVPLGTFQVQGDFESILRHVERWNNAPRLVLVDGLQLSGVSPQLIGQYTATLFILPRAKDDKPADLLPSAGGAPGMGMMPGMRMPGMPSAPMMPGAPMMGAPPSMGGGMPPMGGPRPPMAPSGGAGVTGPALGGPSAPGVEEY
ncbi:MAG: GAS domain-containing protein [Armatimonadetes bacterium]|nr:GAS domain-containing protein [Armatimonadota bacterium]